LFKANKVEGIYANAMWQAGAQEVKSIQGQNNIPFQASQTDIKQSSRKTKIYINKPIVA